MRHESSNRLDQDGVPDAAGEKTQSDETIDDLSPKDRDAADVRGGIIPPSDVRASLQPPNGQPTVYALPPED